MISTLLYSICILPLTNGLSYCKRISTRGMSCLFLHFLSSFTSLISSCCISAGKDLKSCESILIVAGSWYVCCPRKEGECSERYVKITSKKLLSHYFERQKRGIMVLNYHYLHLLTAKLIQYWNIIFF